MVMQDCNPALGELWQKFMASLSYKENWEERMNEYITRGGGHSSVFEQLALVYQHLMDEALSSNPTTTDN